MSPERADGSRLPLLSVVVPAHDEQHLITGCLETMLRGARPGELDVVVVCNGCTDATAERARAVGGDVRVVEIPEASKHAALDAGDAAARSEVRAYVDADVQVDVAALRAVAEALRDPGTLAAAPRLRVDTRRSSWAVRAHYAVWELSDYHRDGTVGSGFYALSAEGRRRFGRFPALIADDLYVRNLFTAAERRTVPGAAFTVPAPATLRHLLRRSVRAAAGNRQWRDDPQAALTAAPQPAPTAGHRRLLGRLAARPRLWPAAPVYALTYLLPRVLGRAKLARGDAGTWERDESTRGG